MEFQEKKKNAAAAETSRGIVFGICGVENAHLYLFEEVYSGRPENAHYTLESRAGCLTLALRRSVNMRRKMREGENAFKTDVPLGPRHLLKGERTCMRARSLPPGVALSLSWTEG